MSEPAAEAMDDFLEQQFAEGQRDSQGVFTVDTRLAQRKLAAFQMRTLESWLLVLVQAAHRGKARGLTITHLPRQSTVVLKGGRHWGWDDLASVLNGGTTTESDLFSFAVMVRSLTAHTGLRGFRLKTPDETIAHWDGQEMSVRPALIEERLQGGEVVLDVFHQAVVEKRSWFFESRGSASAALAALTLAAERAAFASAVPIVCDGRRLSGIHLGAPPGSHRFRRPVALIPLNPEGVPPSDFGTALDWNGSSLGGIEFDNGATEVRPFGAVALLHVTWSKEGRRVALASSRSRLVWVQDGVVVREQTLELEGRLGLTLVASGAGLPTDLSGLHLVESEALFERQTGMARTVPAALEALWQQSASASLASEGGTGGADGVGAAEDQVGGWQAGRGRFMASTFEGGVAFPRGLSMSVPATSMLAALGLGRSSANHWDDALDQELESLAQRAEVAMMLQERS